MVKGVPVAGYLIIAHKDGNGGRFHLFYEAFPVGNEYLPVEGKVFHLKDLRGARYLLVGHFQRVYFTLNQDFSLKKLTSVCLADFWELTLQPNQMLASMSVPTIAI